MLGLHALDRPTMGFDVWGAITEGAKKGVEQYKATPDKGRLALPKFQGIKGGPSLKGLKIRLPSWLTSSARTVSKPVGIVGRNILSSVQARREADKRKAEASANDVGQTTAPPLEYSQEPPSGNLPPAALIAAGVGALGVAWWLMSARRA